MSAADVRRRHLRQLTRYQTASALVAFASCRAISGCDRVCPLRRLRAFDADAPGSQKLPGDADRGDADAQNQDTAVFNDLAIQMRRREVVAGQFARG